MFDLPAESLPQTAHELIRLLGSCAAVELMVKLGGRVFLVPKTDRGETEPNRNALYDIVGAEAARALIHHFGGDRLYIPSCRNYGKQARNRAIVRAYDGGESVGRIALRYSLSERMVWNILKRTVMPADG